MPMNLPDPLRVHAVMTSIQSPRRILLDAVSERGLIERARRHVRVPVSHVVTEHGLAAA